MSRDKLTLKTLLFGSFAKRLMITRTSKAATTLPIIMLPIMPRTFTSCIAKQTLALGSRHGTGGEAGPIGTGRTGFGAKTGTSSNVQPATGPSLMTVAVGNHDQPVGWFTRFAG